MWHFRCSLALRRSVSLQNLRFTGEIKVCMAESPQTFWESWRARLQALANVPQLIRIVWEAGPAVCLGRFGLPVNGRDASIGPPRGLEKNS